MLGQLVSCEARAANSRDLDARRGTSHVVLSLGRAGVLCECMQDGLRQVGVGACVSGWSGMRHGDLSR